jgi:hypothetical protein
MPERLRERILDTCGALTPEQQQLMIEFIWLRAHGPQEQGEQVQKRLMELLESAGVETPRITLALKSAVAELQQALADAETGADELSGL